MNSIPLAAGGLAVLLDPLVPPGLGLPAVAPAPAALTPQLLGVGLAGSLIRGTEGSTLNNVGHSPYNAYFSGYLAPFRNLWLTFGHIWPYIFTRNSHYLYTRTTYGSSPCTLGIRLRCPQAGTWWT